MWGNAEVNGSIMEIRSVTVFCQAETRPERLAGFMAEARAAWDVTVQTVRLATPPFPKWLPREQAEATARVQELAQTWRAVGVDYVSLGPVLLRQEVAWLELLPELLGLEGMVFGAAEMVDRFGRLDFGRIQRLAELIQQLSRRRGDGFGNLYFAALANCPPGCPYFPTAYHAGGATYFALAVESADLAVAAVQGAGDLLAARTRLVGAIEASAERLARPARALAARHGLGFGGLDFSLAPFPTATRSVGTALTGLGVPFVGASGSLLAAAWLTDALQRADFQRCGFNGLMLPALEDSRLAEDVAAGRLTLAHLLQMSAVCGVGLDTIPLPGDVSAGQLSAILGDVAALAARLNKPLTARLMPMPGKAAGDAITFDFPYFAASRVLGVEGAGLGGLLNSAAVIPMQPISSL